MKLDIYNDVCLAERLILELDGLDEYIQAETNPELAAQYKQEMLEGVDRLKRMASTIKVDIERYLSEAKKTKEPVDIYLYRFMRKLKELKL
jgi:hypothetical protein